MMSLILVLIMPSKAVTNVDTLGTEEHICSTLQSNLELTSDELQNLCNYINNDIYIETNLISDARICGTYANMLIDYYYDQYSQSSISKVPSYLSKAKTAVQSMLIDSRSVSTNYYVVSPEGRFIVYYDQTSNPSESRTKAHTLAAIFDEVHDIYCNEYGFEAPTTDGVNYEVHIINGMGACGLTQPTGSAGITSYIQIQQGILDDYMLNNDDAFVKGTAAHEYMHAIMFAYGIPYQSSVLDAMFAHESMGRAVGIEYEISYASHYDIRNKIEYFINHLDIPLGTGTSGEYIYGGSLLFLFTLEEEGDWSIMKDTFENYDSSYTMFENMDFVLRYCGYSTSFAVMYKHFMACNVSPDHMYYSSPYNRGINNASWGQPTPKITHKILSTNAYFTGSGTLQPLSSDFIRINNLTSISKLIVVNVNYSYTGNGVPEGVFMIYNAITDTYTYSGNLVVDDNLYGTFRIVSNGNGVLWLAICNAGFEGEISYSYTITASS